MLYNLLPCQSELEPECSPYSQMWPKGFLEQTPWLIRALKYQLCLTPAMASSDGFICAIPHTPQLPWELGPSTLWLREVSLAAQGHTARTGKAGM